ncbi:hypothetical protein CSUI_002275 [Cystoisospora suis]|uniref:Uncharacterized protein n=1 Tax=Cystoisospora suis TaxID=483139 RepID=A0A2C6L9M4_9APIC|nr:hypothetical protein CSUI_002275 [Cystoisospora suis]
MRGITRCFCFGLKGEGTDFLFLLPLPFQLGIHQGDSLAARRSSSCGSAAASAAAFLPPGRLGKDSELFGRENEFRRYLFVIIRFTCVRLMVSFCLDTFHLAFPMLQPKRPARSSYLWKCKVQCEFFSFF